MDTPYDEVFDVKHDTSRKQQETTLMAAIHTVPKKVADTAQTQGVSEKFLANGLPSGVINPSMMAHDRYLSMMDAIKDVIIIGATLSIAPLLPFGAFTGTIYAIMLLYWFFHIAWWEKTKIWGIKSSVKRYLRNTYYFYWWTFFILFIPIAISLWYLIFEIGIQTMSFGIINSILSVASGAERAIASVFANIEFVRNNFALNANYSVQMDAKIYEDRFTIGSTLFLSLTILSKIVYARLYSNEKKENKEFSESEMRYVGEEALDKIKKAKNA